MRKFVVAKLELFDNELSQQIVNADNEVLAALVICPCLLNDDEADGDTEYPDLDELQDRAIDHDQLISVIEIPKA